MRFTSLAVFAALAGCSIDPRANVRVVSPAFALDVDAERTALEDALCAASSDFDASACDVLTALDASDDGHASAQPRLPLQLPRRLHAGARQSPLFVEPWLEAQRVVHDFLPALRVPLTLDGSDGGTNVDPSLLDGAEVLAASLRLDEDTLTFTMPRMHVSVDRDGEVVEVGVIEAATEGGVGARTAFIHFAEGGGSALIDAVIAGDSAIVVSPQGGLALGEGPASSLVRPGGRALVSFVLEVAVPVMPIVDAAAF